MTHSGFQSRCGAEWVNAWGSAQIGISCLGARQRHPLSPPHLI
jgi:hypothetical protein